MIRIEAPFHGRRFCVSGGILHDLLFEQDDCGINKLDHATIQMFRNKKKALETGAQPCRFCLWIDSGI